DVTQFIVVASTLVLIKSRTLLPLIQLSGEEEQNIDELERRLKLYKLFQELGFHIEQLFLERPIFSRTYAPRDIVFSPDKKMTKANIHAALHEVLATVPQREKLPQKSIEKVIRIEEMMDTLVSRVQKGIQLSFHQFV